MISFIKLFEFDMTPEDFATNSSPLDNQPYQEKMGANAYAQQQVPQHYQQNDISPQGPAQQYQEKMGANAYNEMQKMNQQPYGGPKFSPLGQLGRSFSVPGTPFDPVNQIPKM